MIEAYCKQFFGYGRWDAPVWFVGLEEAGAGTPEELQVRLAAWDQRGRRELEDAPAFYPTCGQHQWHGPNATLQRTWRQLIRILLLARGEPVAEEALLEYQKHTLGALSGHVCLTELSPLPTRKQTHWPYAGHQGLPEWGESRALFAAAFAALRAATLREKIALHHPRVVVFYFWKHRRSAEAVAGGEFCPVLPEKLLGLERNGTAYFVTGHPAGNYSDTYFTGLGQHFHEHYRDLFAAQHVALLQKSIALAASIHSGQTYQTRLDPLPADPRCCHPPRNL